MHSRGLGALILSGVLALLAGVTPAAVAEPDPPASCVELLEGLAKPHPSQARFRFSAPAILDSWKRSRTQSNNKKLFMSARRQFSAEAKRSALRAFEVEQKNLDRWLTRRRPYFVPEKFIRARANRLLRAASAHLEAQNVPHTLYLGPHSPYLDIEPGAQSPLNEFARELQRSMPTARLQYWPHETLNENDGFFQTANDQDTENDWALIALSHEAIRRASPLEPQVEHETVHADNYFLLRKGILSPYQASANAAEGSVLPRSILYPDHLSFDELEAYQVDVEAGLQRYLEEMDIAARDKTNHVSDFLMQLKQVRITARSATAIAALAAAATERLASKGPQGTANFTHDGLSYETSLRWSRNKWNIPQAKLHIASSAPSAPGKTVDFELTVPLASAHLASLQKTLSHLQQGAQASRERFDAIDSTLQRYMAERDQPTGAALRAELLRLSQRWALPGSPHAVDSSRN
jgi:hypothetical protein